VPSNGVSALDLTGAWAVSADQCSKVFTRRGRANVRRRPPEYCSVEYAPILEGLRKADWKE
jgi:hypothetical protein